MSTGDQVFDDQVDAAYQAVEGLLDTRLSSLPWKRETYRQRAATWLSGLVPVEIKSNSDKEPDEIKRVTLKAQVDQIQAQVSVYEAEANGNGFIKNFKKAWRWLFGEKNDITLKRYWLSYQQHFSLIETLHKTSDVKQRELAGRQLQISLFEGMPNLWQKAFEAFKKWIPQYLAYLQPGGATMLRRPSEAKYRAEAKGCLSSPKKSSAPAKKTDASKLEKQPTRGRPPTEAIPESKSGSFPLSPRLHEAKNSDQSLSIATLASKSGLESSLLLNKHSTNVGNKEGIAEEGKSNFLNIKNHIKEMSAEQKRTFFRDLLNYVVGCGLLNLNPFEGEPLTIKKVKSHCIELKKEFHPDQLQGEKIKRGIEENMRFYDRGIEARNTHFNTISEGFGYLKTWFEKHEKAPKLSTKSLSFLDYTNYKKQHKKALNKSAKNISNIEESLYQIAFEKTKKQLAEKFVTIEQNQVKTQETLEQLILLMQQRKLAVPAVDPAVPLTVSEQKESSTMTSKVLLAADPAMKPVSFSDSSQLECGLVVDTASRSFSPVRVTRELYSDVFKAGTDAVAQTAAKDSSPSLG